MVCLVPWQNVISVTTLRHHHDAHSCYDNIFMTPLVYEHGRQCMPSSAKFSMPLQTEILSTETSDFLKQRIIIKSFNSVLIAAWRSR